MTTPRPTTRVPETQQKAILAAEAAGTPITTIANDHGLDESTIRRILTIHGVGPRRKGALRARILNQVITLRGQGVSIREIAEQAGCSHSYILRLLKQAGAGKPKRPARRQPKKPAPTRRPDIDKEEVVRLYQAGLTAKQVADKIGCVASYVSQILATAGVSTRTSRPPRKLAAIDPAEVARLYLDERLSQEKISQRLGVSVTYVRIAMRRAGVQSRIGAQPATPISAEEQHAQVAADYAAGHPMEAIRDRYGLTSQAVRDIAVAAGIPLRSRSKPRTVDWDLVATLHAQGLTTREIAQRARTSMVTVRRIVRRSPSRPGPDTSRPAPAPSPLEPERPHRRSR